MDFSNKVRIEKIICYEIDRCEEYGLPDLLDEYDVGDQVTFDELRDMGWKGVIDYEGKIEHISKYLDS